MLRRPMIASIASAFADLSLVQLALIAGMALIASMIGGVTGYGTGALMPLVLVPIVGAEPVVPIIAISATITNVSRALAFRRAIDWRRVALVVVAGAMGRCLVVRGAAGAVVIPVTALVGAGLHGDAVDGIVEARAIAIGAA